MAQQGMLRRALPLLNVIVVVVVVVIIIIIFFFYFLLLLLLLFSSWLLKNICSQHLTFTKKAKTSFKIYHVLSLA